MDTPEDKTRLRKPVDHIHRWGFYKKIQISDRSAFSWGLGVNVVVPATRVHRVAKTRGSGILDPGFEIHEGPEYTRKNRKIESTGTAVNDDFRVGSGASPAILRPFRDSHFVTSRRRACRQDVGVLPRKSPGKAHCVWRLPRFTGTGAIHRSVPFTPTGKGAECKR